MINLFYQTFLENARRFLLQISDKLKTRYKVALNNARTLEYQLAMLCGYANDPDASREAISCLLGVAWELSSPVIDSIEAWAEAEGLSNG